MAADTIAHVTPVFDCRETVRRLWDYLDRELSPEDMAAVDAHLTECVNCPPHFVFEQAFLTALKSARSQEPAGRDLRARVHAALGIDASESPTTGHSHE